MSQHGSGDSTSPLLTSVAVAIPAYNEADGIEEFLTELDQSLNELAESHTFVVVDDRSSDGTLDVLEGLRSQLDGDLVVVQNPMNQGHGPTVIRAYNRAIATGAEWILQVDGDGQFFGADIAKLAAPTREGAAFVTGARNTRFDPWYRRVITTSLPLALRVGFGAERGDVNCPFRLYRSDVLAELLTKVPDSASTPHVLLTVLEERSDLPHEEVVVDHRVRRGDSEVGTTWGQARNYLIPRRLMRFVGGAARELIDFRRSL